MFKGGKVRDKQPPSISDLQSLGKRIENPVQNLKTAVLVK